MFEPAHYYHYYAAFNALCVGHNGDELQVQLFVGAKLYCLRRLADGHQCTQVREKTLEFRISVSLPRLASLVCCSFIVITVCHPTLAPRCTGALCRCFDFFVSVLIVALLWLEVAVWFDLSDCLHCLLVRGVDTLNFWRSTFVPTLVPNPDRRSPIRRRGSRRAGGSAGAEYVVRSPPADSYAIQTLKLSFVQVGHSVKA